MEEKEISIENNNQVLNCYYNICNYYNKDYEIIKRLLGVN